MIAIAIKQKFVHQLACLKVVDIHFERQGLTDNREHGSADLANLESMLHYRRHRQGAKHAYFVTEIEETNS
jgi:hypothetical protein